MHDYILHMAQCQKGRAAALSLHMGYSPAFVSNVKAGRKKLPTRALKKVIEFSGGVLTYEALIPDGPLRKKAS